MVREAQIIDLYWDLRTTLANYADHLWSAEQTLGITGIDIRAWLEPVGDVFGWTHLHKTGIRATTDFYLVSRGDILYTDVS